MHPLAFQEFKFSHRRSRDQRRRIVVAGLIAVALPILLAWGRALSPLHLAVNGMATAGLILFAGLHGLHREQHLSRAGQRLVAATDRWYPAALLLLQSLFVSLNVVVLWFTIGEIGFPLTPALHLQLLVLLLLAALRRLLHATMPAQPSPPYELLIEFMRYANASLVAVFFATLLSRVILPPDERLTDSLPAGLVLVWIAASLVVITSLVLFLDFILRKMPAPRQPGVKDVL